MAFPDITTLSPQDGAVHLIGEVKFVFSTATGKWEKIDEIATARFVAPVNPYNGQLWFDTDTSGRLYIWNEAATSWIQLTGHQLDGGGNATTGYVDSAIANLVDSSPATLNTLNEIAQAIGDDPNFGASITSSITNKLNTSDFTTTANTWANTNLNLSTIGDVSTNPPVDGQILKFDNASSMWYAATPVSAADDGAVMSNSVSTANMSFVIDEDNMASNSNTTVPTQQSVKSYVDNSVVALSSLSSQSGTLDDIGDGVSFVRSENNFTTALETKLQGVTAFADITGTANVTAAGAVMASTFSTHLPNSGAVLLSTLVSDIDTVGGVVMESASNGSAKIPNGTTAQRDSTAVAGFFRWNTTTSSAEIYDGSAWGAVGGGNATSEIMWEHSRNVSSNYQISSGNNAVAAGTISIDTGGSVEIPTGSTWSIV